MIPELTYREWPERFEAVRFPRGNLVVAFPQRWVEASCTSMEVAEEHAAAMNRWLAAKPQPSLAPALPNFTAPATERQLFDLLDRGLDPERKAEALKAGQPEATRHSSRGVTGPRNRETPGVTSSVTERLEAREVVTVCGSMRHYNQMLALANELTLEGKIVLLPFVLKVDDPGMDDRLQALHRDKIALSSAIYVVGSPDGQSTSEEVAFARARGLAVRLDGGNP